MAPNANKTPRGQLQVNFSRRFRRKSRFLQWLVFFRQFNAKRPLFVH